MTPRFAVIGFALLSLLHAGCKNRKRLTPAEMNALVDKHLADEAAAVRKLDALVAISPLMEAVPPMISAKAFGPLTGKARLSDALYWQTENVLCVTAEGLKLGPATESLFFPSPTDLDWRMACRFLAKVRAAKSAGVYYGDLHHSFGCAAKIEYVVVVRGTWTPAKIKSATSFDAGSFIGDAQVFSIGDKTEHLGGVPLAATNSKEVSFRDRAGRLDNDAAQALNKDLNFQVLKHLCQQLARYGGVEIPAKFREVPVTPK
jgi:hypothetical protein